VISFDRPLTNLIHHANACGPCFYASPFLLSAWWPSGSLRLGAPFWIQPPRDGHAAPRRAARGVRKLSGSLLIRIVYSATQRYQNRDGLW
jgi:hypothetical protein